MKKTVLTFGLLSGAMMSLLMAVNTALADRIGFDRAEVVGYTIIVASFLLVYFGIRSYREHVAQGPLTFGRAFTVGILITLLSSACYVITWEIYGDRLAPGFVDKYAAHLMDKARAEGATEQELEAKAREIESLKRLYEQPLMRIAFVFLEPFPIGLGVTLISAAVLRRKNGAATAPSRSPAVL
jgi:hypothetical protein